MGAAFWSRRGHKTLEADDTEGYTTARTWSIAMTRRLQNGQGSKLNAIQISSQLSNFEVFFFLKHCIGCSLQTLDMKTAQSMSGEKEDKWKEGYWDCT